MKRPIKSLFLPQSGVAIVLVGFPAFTIQHSVGVMIERLQRATLTQSIHVTLILNRPIVGFVEVDYVTILHNH